MIQHATVRPRSRSIINLGYSLSNEEHISLEIIFNKVDIIFNKVDFIFNRVDIILSVKIVMPRRVRGHVTATDRALYFISHDGVQLNIPLSRDVKA